MPTIVDAVAADERLITEPTGGANPATKAGAAMTSIEMNKNRATQIAEVVVMVGIIPLDFVVVVVMVVGVVVVVVDFAS